MKCYEFYMIIKFAADIYLTHSTISMCLISTYCTVPNYLTRTAHHAYFWLAIWKDTIWELLRKIITTPKSNTIDDLYAGMSLDKLLTVSSPQWNSHSTLYLFIVSFYFFNDVFLYFVSLFKEALSEEASLLTAQQTIRNPIHSSNITDKIRCFTNYEPRYNRQRSLSSRIIYEATKSGNTSFETQQLLESGLKSKSGIFFFNIFHFF